MQKLKKLHFASFNKYNNLKLKHSFSYKFIFSINTNKNFCESIIQIQQEKKLNKKFPNKTFTFIKENSKLSDLNFKEELFEFAAIKAEQLNDSEINLILDKLKDKKILESEIKDFKHLIKNILSACNDSIKQETLLKFIKYYLAIHKDIKIYLDPNYISIENNGFDLFFDNLNASLLNKAMMNITNANKSSDFIYFFQLVNLVIFSPNEIKYKFINYIQINFLLNNNLSEISDSFQQINLIMFLLENINFYRSNKIPLDKNFIEILKCYQEKISLDNNINFLYNEDFIKRRKTNKISQEEIKLFSYIFGCLNEWTIDYKSGNKIKKDTNTNMKLRRRKQNDEIEKEEKIINEKEEIIEKEKFYFIKTEEDLKIVECLLRKIESVSLNGNKIPKKNLLQKFKENMESLNNINSEDKENFIDTQINGIMERTLQEMKIIKK